MMYRKPLVPDNFIIPQLLVTDQFLLRPLTMNDNEKDYAAVKKSGHASPNLTLEQNLIDLGWHEKEFQKRSSFAYTVMDASDKECLGCIYLYPADDPQYDMEVSMWIIKKDLDSLLFSTVQKWLKTSWPFKSVFYAER